MGYPQRLMWTTLKYHHLPRRLKACGSHSRAFAARRGILAGCSHSMAALMVATAGALERLARFDVVPRALADDASAAWVGQDFQGARVLWEAVNRCRRDVADVGPAQQAFKSGYVASSRQGKAAAEPFARRVKIGDC